MGEDSGLSGMALPSFSRWALYEQQLLFDTRNSRTGPGPGREREVGPGPGGVDMDEGVDNAMGREDWHNTHSSPSSSAMGREEWHSHWWGS